MRCYVDAPQLIMCVQVRFFLLPSGLASAVPHTPPPTHTLFIRTYLRVPYFLLQRGLKHRGIRAGRSRACRMKSVERGWEMPVELLSVRSRYLHATAGICPCCMHFFVHPCFFLGLLVVLRASSSHIQVVFGGLEACVDGLYAL